MTTKEIAEAVGKTERCVQGWAKKTGEKISLIGEKISSVQKSGIAADYTLDETMSIIETGMGKNAALIWRENAGRSVPAVLEQMSDPRMDRLEAMVEKLVGLVAAMIPTQISSRIALPAPKPLTLRAELNQVVKHGTVGSEVGARWSELYTAFYYRNHINLRVKARNADMDKLDFAEEKNLLPELLSLAYELFQED